MKTIYIQILKGDHVERTAKFAQENIILGSGPAAHLRLDGSGVSRIHAMLKLDESGHAVLSDLGWSSEGTLLNGLKINKETLLESGAEIRLGETRVRVFTTPPGDYASQSSLPAAPPADDSDALEAALSEMPLLTIGDELENNPTAITARPSVENFAKPAAKPAPQAAPKPAPASVQPAAKPAPAPAPKVAPKPVVEEIPDDLPDLSAPSLEEPPPPAFAQDDDSGAFSDDFAPPAPRPRASAQPVEPPPEIDLTPIPFEQLPPEVRKHMVGDDTPKGKRLLQVSFTWDGRPLDVGHFDKPRLVTLGVHPLNDFSIANEKFPEKTNFPLVVPSDGGFGIFFTDAFEGSVIDAKGQERSLRELGSSAASKTFEGLRGSVYTLGQDERLTLLAGELTVEYQFVYPSQVYPKKVYRHVDFLYWRVISFCAILHFALILMFQFVPLEMQSLGDDVLKGRFAKMIVVPPAEEDKKPEQKKFELKKEEKKEEKKEDVKEDKKEKVKEDAPVDQKQRDMQRVKKSGLLGLLSSGMGDMGGGGDLFGRADQTNQFLGKVLGTAGGSNFGMGLGGRGFGSGDGGGGGMYGGGGGWGYGGKKRVYGRGGMNLRGKGKSKEITQIQPGQLILKGSLTKEQIARVIRMNWAQIKYCYESQLTQNPTLAGKILVKWVIGGDGSVQSSRVIETTMNNERVENCITRRIERWKFPAPQGGGIVEVNYPFIFRVAG